MNYVPYDPLKDLLDTIPKIIVPKDTYLELECRFSIDGRKSDRIKTRQLSPSETTRLAKNIINDHLSKQTQCEIEQSINFIKSDKTIKQLIFINGKQDKNRQKHYKKNKITNSLIIVANPTYKIALSLEESVTPFDIITCHIARIKLRFSIILEPWRLDITLIKQVPDFVNPSIIKEYKSKTLYEININNFIDKAPWDFIDYIEFEAEYINKLDKITVADFINISNIMESYMNTLYTGDLPLSCGLTQDDPLNFMIDHSQISEQIIKKKLMEDYHKHLYQIALYINPKTANKFKHNYSIKQLSNQVIELDKFIFLSNVYPKITEYYITDKVDGQRALIHINENGAWALTDELIHLGDSHEITTTFVFDTEKYETEEHIIYYIFDVIVWKNQSLIDQPFSERKTYFSDAIKIANSIPYLTLKTKPFFRLTKTFQTEILTFKNNKKSYETDGLIFTPVDGQYCTMKVYKYKPIDKLSIDFLIKECPKQLKGLSPFISKKKHLYLLFNGISYNVFNKLVMDKVKYHNILFSGYAHARYFPIPFNPSDRYFAYLYESNKDGLDGQIGEFIIKNTKNLPYEYEWQLLRIRTDRQIDLQNGVYFGNNYQIAEKNWFNYQNPLIIEKLTEQDLGYFQVHDSELQRATRNYNSFVKATIFETFYGTEYVMDLASGKGQDLFRYAKYNMKHVLFIEKDKTALMELLNRKHIFATQPKNSNAMQILIQALDLNNPYTENIQQINKSCIPIPNSGYSLIMCNFAFHYFLANTQELTNIVKFISHYLCPGGRFIFTGFDGQAVFDLLKKNNGYWVSQIPNKFGIKKKYKGSILHPTGQQIEVLLPFSNNQYYDEYLINISHIAKIFKQVGMILETKQCFSEYLDRYKKENLVGYNQLDSDDLTYIKLYHYYGFYKEIKKNKKS